MKKISLLLVLAFVLSLLLVFSSCTVEITTDTKTDTDTETIQTDTSVETETEKESDTETETETEEHTHVEEKIPAVEPTCETEGHTAGKKCSICGEILKAPTKINALGHTSQILQRVEPTCEKAGLTKGHLCSTCGEVLIEQEEIPALGHDFQFVSRQDPTCIADGFDVYSCSRADQCKVQPEQRNKVVKSSKYHSFIANDNLPTCVEGGWTEKVCEHCEASSDHKTLAALGHTFERTYQEGEENKTETVVAKPTCEENGSIIYKCAECTEVLLRTYEELTAENATDADKALAATIKAIGHDYTVENKVVKAGCLTAGYTIYDCKNGCGTTTQSAITPALGHTFERTYQEGEENKTETVVAKPTCEANGSITYKCAECTEVLLKTYEELTAENATDADKALAATIKAIGHDYTVENKVVKADCLTAGYTIYDCKNGCGTTTQSAITPALGHTYEREGVTEAIRYKTVLEQTCITDGKEWAVCDECDNCAYDDIATEYSLVIPADGEHDHTKLIARIGATCFKQGYDIYQCTRDEKCTVVKYENFTAPLGHNCVNGECTRCGQSCYISTKDNPSTKWSGKTLDVLATRWYGTPSKEESGTWSQPEFYVTGYLQTEKYGRSINDAVWARQEFIKNTYGVTVLWHDAKNDAVMQNELQSGLEAGNDKFHIALPRMFEAQSLIAAETVYDLANSEYIDLSASYYNQASVESFSVYGHTFFVAGDFSFVDEDTASILFYNQTLSESVKMFPNLYNKVENGEWTISELAKWAKTIGKDDDGTSGYQDTDTYGFGSTSLSAFFQASGIQQVKTQTVTGTNYKEYYISLNEDGTAVNDLITQLRGIKDATWARTEWAGGYGAMEKSFTDGKLLFYNQAAFMIREFPAQDDNFKVGVLPMPKLYEEQESYYAPLNAQTTVMCIPKANNDREMSEYFFDVLSWTGQEYVMRAYYETLELKLYNDGETSRDDALRMLKDYIFPGMCYDQGYMKQIGTSFLTEVQTEAVNSSNASAFISTYMEKYADANKQLNDPKTGWNTYAKNYKD